MLLLRIVTNVNHDSPDIPAVRLGSSVEKADKSWRRLLRPIGLVLTIAFAVAGVVGLRPNNAHIGLYSTSVGILANGDRVLVQDKGHFYLDSRVIKTQNGGTAEARAALLQRNWLAAGTIPMAQSRFGDMSRDALLDINTLTVPSGGVVAAWSDHWRYIWPRDAAFAAAALAQTGHVTDALRNLEFLQGVQAPDGTFQARYLPDGSGFPDDRGVQLDGIGWSLWGSYWTISHAGTPSAQRSAANRIQTLISKSTEAAVRLTEGPDRLPPVSSDYWETKETKLTLGTAAAMLSGLRSAAAIQAILGDRKANQQLTDHANEVETAIHQRFGPEGYPRTVGGKRDTAVAFLLPPFQPRVNDSVLKAFSLAADEMRRPAGGLAPGAGWKDDGISWTPETAIFALVSAHVGDTQRADKRLDWLNEHRTSDGSLPEKVLHDGSPAAVAPLAWTSATVLLTLAQICQAEPMRCPS